MHLERDRAAFCFRFVMLCLLILSPLVGALPLSAQTKPGDFESADGLENWKDSIDLGAYPTGKYNLIVESKDKAGNVTRSTPMNVYVDPKSDLPLVSIVNPTPLMRVGGDLNIVGTAVDDDAVDHVEISLDGGEYQKAVGKEFWSLYLKTAEIPEGRRTLDVRAVDINGLTGPSVRVKFDLDRTKPLATVDTPVAGSLVSGLVKLSGTVYDANGIRSLEVSQDGGKKWAPVSVKTGWESFKPSFSWSVDTKKLGDGPKVFMFRSVDMCMSSSVSAYLLFVDNTKPTIELARPAVGAAVNGRFAITGAVRDAVGIKKLSYEFGPEEKGEIPLTAGDPYFAKVLDADKIKGDSAQIALIAEDKIGNVTRITRLCKIDREADKPVLKVFGPSPPAPALDAKGKPLPAAAAFLRPGDYVWGSIRDDDGAAAFRWSLDGGAPVEVPCSEVFSLALPDASTGKHSLSLTPVDVNGLAGHPVTLPLFIDKGPGSVIFDRITSSKPVSKDAPAPEPRAFSQGIEAAVDSGEQLELSIESPNALVSAEYSIAGGARLPLAKLESKDKAAGPGRFRIALDRALPYGFAQIEVFAKDAAENEFGSRALLYVTDYGIAREEPGFRFSDPRVQSDGTVLFGLDPSGAPKSLSGAFYGGDLSSLRFDPPTDLVSASYDGRVVTIAPKKDGRSVPTRILGKTTKGREFASSPFVFVTDATPPKLSIDAPAEGTWFNKKITVTGMAQDSGGAVALSWRRLPDGEAKKVEIKKDGSFSFDLVAADIPSGPFSFELAATDAQGAVSRAYRGLGADAKGPELRFLSPESGASVWGPEDVVGMISSASGIASVEYAADGVTFAAIERSGVYFVHRADLAANPKAAYRVKDAAGNALVARPDVVAGPAPLRPAASASVSIEPAGAEARIELSGQSGALKASLVLPGLAEADYAALGDASAPLPERFASGRLLVQGPLSLKGKVAVGGAVKAVSFSSDDGATYKTLASNKEEKSAKSELQFSLSVEAAALGQQGAARWIVKVEDFAGAVYLCPLYCFVDTQAPSLAAIYPEADAKSLPGPFPLILKVEDSSPLAAVDLALGGTKAAPLATATEGGRYLAVMVDPASAKGSPLALGLSAKDSGGNESKLALKYGYDQAADAPKIAVDSLVPEVGGLVSGLASDDDGPLELVASIDGADERSFPSGSFAFALPSLAPGKHILSLKAGETIVKKDFAIKAGAPALGDFAIVEGKGSSPWAPGADFALGAASVLSGSLSGGNGQSTVSASFNGGAPLQASTTKMGTDGSLSFSVPIPASLPYALVSVELRAKDAAGLESIERLELHKILPPAAGSDDDEGIRFADSRIASAEGRSSFLIAPGDTLRGRFNGRPIKSVAIVPATPALAASFDGSAVAIEAKAPGLVASASLSLTTVDGDTFVWGPFSAAIDADAPKLDVSAPANDDWNSKSVRIAGKSSDAEGIVSLSLAVNGGEAAAILDPAALAKAKGEPSFDQAWPIDAIEDGPARLDFVARDGAGRESRVTRFINKDATPPVLTQVLPAPDESVNGLTTFVAEVVDAGRLASVSFVESKGAKPEILESVGAFWRDLDLVHLAMPMAEGCGFVATDKAGNSSLLSPSLTVDKEKDKPVVEIDTPGDLEVLRGDFVISGSAFDDDGLAFVYYRIDGGQWIKIEMTSSSFTVPVALKDTTDNEHLVEAKAEDIYGVQGDVVSRKYRISKEEPRALMTAPPIEKPVRGKVKLSGSSSDANGVKEVSVSVDNRTSYGAPLGAESWGIDLDTTSLADGLHAVAVRPVDGYDTEGFYASMVSIDNTPPTAQLDLPLDGEGVSSSLLVSGRVADNIAIAKSRIEISPVGSTLPPAIVLELGTDKIVQSSIDVSGLKSGVYTVRLVVDDRADNESLASRNVKILGALPLDSLSLLFPLEGEARSGRLRVQGRAAMASGALAVSILADGAEIGSAEPDALGWYSFDVPSGALADGEHRIKARTTSKEGRSIESDEHRVEWKTLGPWVSIDSFPSGKYLPYRPFLSGNSGWLAEAAPTDKEALAAYKKAAESRRVLSVEVSLDDGSNYTLARGTTSWNYRLETQDFKEGVVHAIVRARYADGSTACAKGLYYLDKTPPQVAVIAPVENGRYNGALAVSGHAYDENGLAEVKVALRKGDKASYEVPSFIQGLYFDGQVLGATTWQAGLGLTFFNDNVKLEALYGHAPEYDSNGEAESFYGPVVGGKLIANVFYLPASSLFGPDWSFLSTSLGLGANFTYFTQTQADTGLFVGSIFAQLEFPKITFSGMSAFKKFSAYTEFQLWVLSSVVNGGFIPKMSFGARVGVF